MHYTQKRIQELQEQLDPSLRLDACLLQEALSKIPSVQMVLKQHIALIRAIYLYMDLNMKSERSRSRKRE